MNKLNFEWDGDVISYDIPTSWDDVSVYQAALLKDIKKFEDFETEYEWFVEILTTLNPDIDEDHAYGLDEEQYLTVIGWLNFTTIQPQGKVVESIMVGEDEYFLKTDFNKLTNAEVISIKMIEKKHSKHLHYALPEMLCVLLRQKKENGKLESFRSSFMERAESFKHIKITDVIRLFDFFASGKSQLLSSSQDSSQENRTQESEADI